MKKLMQLELEDGSKVWVESNIDDDDLADSAGGPVLCSAEDIHLQRMSEVTAGIGPLATTIFGRLANLNLEEATLELGLKFGAKAGIVFSSVDSEATFKLSLKWKPPKNT
ncbi:MAG: Trypsin-co-occurring domain 1 [Pseudomonadota bacterium]|jgi:hypothetical protein